MKLKNWTFLLIKSWAIIRKKLNFKDSYILEKIDTWYTWKIKEFLINKTEMEMSMFFLVDNLIKEVKEYLENNAPVSPTTEQYFTILARKIQDKEINQKYFEEINSKIAPILSQINSDFIKVGKIEKKSSQEQKKAKKINIWDDNNWIIEFFRGETKIWELNIEDLKENELEFLNWVEKVTIKYNWIKIPNLEIDNWVFNFEKTPIHNKEKVIAKIKEKYDLEKYLLEKQKDKMFKDTGERVGGSKKELAYYNSVELSKDEVIKMDVADILDLATKSKILKKIWYSIEQDKEEDINPWVLYMKNILLNWIKAKPKDHNFAKWYYIIVPEVISRLANIKTKKEMDEFLAEMDKRIIWFTHPHFRDMPQYELKECLGRKITDIIRHKIKNKEIYEMYDKLSINTKEDLEKKYLYHKNILEERLKILKERQDKSWGFQRNIEHTEQLLNTTYASMDNFAKAKGFDISEEGNKRKREMVLEELNTKKKTKSSTKTEVSAEIEEMYKEFKERYKLHNFKPLTEVKRVWGREVKREEIINPDTIIENFGYKYVELGNWVKDNEAYYHIGNFIGAMKDLEDILGFDMKKLNQKAWLSISFGARGRKGAVAHYEPLRKLIALTKKDGDGSVAHEFFHYLDNVIMEFLTKDKDKRRYWDLYLSGAKNGKTFFNSYFFKADEVWKTRIEQLISEFYSILRDKESKTEIRDIMFLPKKYNWYYPWLKALYDRAENEGIEKNKDKIEKVLEYMREKEEGWDMDTIMKYLQNLADMTQENVVVKEPIKIVWNEYYNNSKIMGDYGVYPTELFARAFESYVLDKLKEKGMYNNYLVAENAWNPVYPQGEERKAYNKVFDKIMLEIKKIIENNV